MKLRAELAAIAGAVKYVQGAVPTRTTLPTLEHVRLDASGNRVSLWATDLTVEASAQCPAEVMMPGSVLVPGHLLASLIERAPKKATEIDLVVQDHRAVVTIGRSRAEFGTLPVDDFPSLPAIGDDAISWSMPAATLREMFVQTRGSVETGAREYLQGVNLDHEDNNRGGVFSACATDGHRLVHVWIDAPEGCRGLPSPGITVPTDSLKQIDAILADAADVTISTDRVRVMLSVEGRTLSTALVGGEYPAYRRMIPPLNGAMFSASADELDEAVNRASVVLASDGMARGVTLTATETSISVEAQSSKGDIAGEDVSADESRPGSKIKLNARYLRDALALWGDAVVRFQQDAPGGPVLLTSEAKPTMRQIIMPTR